MDEELKALEAEAQRIAALRADTRTPAIVRRAFLRPSPLTLRRFLRLEEIDSPALTGKWPLDDPVATWKAFTGAWEILFPKQAIPHANRLTDAIEEVANAVLQGFSTVMAVRWPSLDKQPNHESAKSIDNTEAVGWVSIFISKFGLDVKKAMDMPLEQLFILAAAGAVREGAEVTGQDYRERT